LNTTQQPILQNLKTELPEKNSSKHLGLEQKKVTKTTLEPLEKMAKLRMDKAHLMGKSSYAELNLMDQMAQKPEKALDLLAHLATPAVAQAKKKLLTFRN
jgi:peptidyl-dipeptidase Dcp